MLNIYSDLDKVIELLEAAQDSDSDIREKMREASHFLDKRNGQWEPEIFRELERGRRPRYTFDRCNPIVDQVAGEMEEAEFTLRIKPSGGDATKDNARVLDGLIRNIRNISNAEAVFNAAGRMMITTGFGACEVTHELPATTAWDHEMFIRALHNAIDRVWFDETAQEQDNSDAMHVFVLDELVSRVYKEEFPKAKTKSSLGQDRTFNVYIDKPTDTITVGRILYKKREDTEIVLMTNGMVYEVDDDFERVRDELEAQGVNIELDDRGEEKRRLRNGFRVYSRMFNNDEWLTKEEKTVFKDLPICATYANFKISENKRIVRGIVEHLMDPQRVLNYATSRMIEEGALAPRAKYWMTEEQSEGYEEELASMNLNAEPVQHYNHVAEQPPPFFQGGAQINQGLQETALQAAENITKAAGLFSSNIAENPGLQSGRAIDSQISQGNNSTIKYFRSQEVFICYVGKVMLGAIPEIYDSMRTVRIVQDDGSFEMQTLNQIVFDSQSQQNVELNNLSAGTYDAVCVMGAAFKSRQRETAQAFADMAAIDPSIIDIAQDVWLKNIDMEGFEDVSKRSRAIKLQQGLIPEDQWTDEEIQQAQEAQQQQEQQEPEQDPNLVFALAEQGKAQAELQNAENKRNEVEMESQINQGKLSLEQDKLLLERDQFDQSTNVNLNVDAAKIDQNSRKIDQTDRKLDMDREKQTFTQELALLSAQFEQAMRMQRQEIENLKTQADSWKVMREASGVDAIVGPGVVTNFKEQADIVHEQQHKVSESREVLDIEDVEIDINDTEV